MTLRGSSILHIVRNSVDQDSRVLKETGSLLDFFPELKLLIAGFYEPGSLLSEDIDGRKIKRFSLSLRKLPKNILAQLVKYIEWHCRVISYYSKFKIKIIHCHDLLPLAIAVHLKLLTGAKLIYDAHELETEMSSLTGLRKVLSKPYEYFLIRFVDQMITVSPSILGWYKKRFQRMPIQLVRNIPIRALSSSRDFVNLRELYGLEKDDLLFIYLGGISKGRGVRTILNAFADPMIKHHVLFMGTGPMLEEVIEASKLNSRIHYRSPVPPGEVTSYVNSADIGLCLYEDTCLNHRYCLPNKLFESMISGLPVLASNLPDQALLVNKYKAGWIVNPHNDSVHEFLDQITRAKAVDIRAGLLDRTFDLSWENEQLILIDVYKSLLCDLP